MYSRLRKALQNKDKGFTLIELLVVIVIIGILAAIAIPIFLSQRAKATDAGVKSDIRSVATEMETFYTDAQAYPVALNVNNTANPVTFTSASGAVDTVRLSTGNTVTGIVPNALGTAYCISMANVNGDTFLWESDKGGLQTGPLAAGTKCDTTAYHGTAIV